MVIWKLNGFYNFEGNLTWLKMALFRGFNFFNDYTTKNF